MMTRQTTIHLTALLALNSMVIALVGQEKFEITLRHNDQKELQTREQLQRLVAAHDLSKWVFTRKLAIDSDRSVIPHSHPVLTLSVRHLKDDELLLSTFVNEQLHWFLTQNEEKTEAVVKELLALFPKVPFGSLEGGDSEESTYHHLIVNWLEYQADRELMGELKARQVIEFWCTDHYTWIYRTVLEQDRKIGRLLYQNRLEPGLPAQK
ncbi:MAG TPA: hypothetical protein VFD58_09405 [Blastocatellia bacterium]|nr:hypothetical protein [Blastocatellia bacterium]